MGKPQSFLGIEITREKGEMYLSQSSYLRSLLKRFKMEDCNPVKTMKVKLEIKSEKRTDKPCRELIGCLMYVMTATRPDLSAAVNYLSRYQTNPTEELWVCLKRVLRYIKGTLDLKLCYRKGKQDVLLAYAELEQERRFKIYLGLFITSFWKHGLLGHKETDQCSFIFDGSRVHSFSNCCC